MVWSEVVGFKGGPSPRAGHVSCLVDMASTEPSLTAVSGDGLVRCVAGVQGSFLIEARDKNGNRRWSGRDPFTSWVECFDPAGDTPREDDTEEEKRIRAMKARRGIGAIFRCTVSDHGDGQYTGRYVRRRAEKEEKRRLCNRDTRTTETREHGRVNHNFTYVS